MATKSGFGRRALLRGGLSVTAVGALGLTTAGITHAGTGTSGSTSGRGRAASAEEPQIHGTQDWGAAAPDQDIVVLDHVPTYIVVHHTAGGNSDDFSLEHAKEIARSIQSQHMNQGWGDSGQQFTNSRGGHRLEGRHQSLEVVRGGTQHVQGAHVGGHNDETIGIENEGLYTDVDVPNELWDSLVALVGWMAGQYGTAVENIVGHRDFNSTECPGEVLYGRLPELRDAVASATGVRSESPAVWPLLRPNTSGPQVRAAQHLLRAKGFDSLRADGVFGSVTREAVAKLASEHRIKQHTCSAAYHTKTDETGFLGSDIWPLITPRTKPGENSEVAEAVATLRRAGGKRTSSEGALTQRDWKGLLS